MEGRLGYDFSRVRIHADHEAAQSAKALNAVAYTLGQHIVFGQGRYTPQTSEGQRLVAHELVHVLQQRGSMSPVNGNGKLQVSDPGGPEEREAEHVANGSAHGIPAVSTRGSALQIARQEDDIPGRHKDDSKVRQWIKSHRREIRKSLTPLIDALEQEIFGDEFSLWPTESLNPEGLIVIEGFDTEEDRETVEARRNRLTELADDLTALAIRLYRRRIPSAWLGGEIAGSGGVTVDENPTGGAARLYAHYAEELGRDIVTIHKNLGYINAFEPPTMGAEGEETEEAEEAEGAQKEEAGCNSMPTDLFIILDDPKNRPTDYTYAGIYSTWGDTLTPVYKDVCGVGSVVGQPFFYYKENGEKQYLDARTEEEVKESKSPSWESPLHSPPGPPLPTRQAGTHRRARAKGRRKN